MKNWCPWKLWWWTLGNILIVAQGPANGAPPKIQTSAPPASSSRPSNVEIVERGPHHRVVRNAGSVCTELATGLHYRENDQWQETQELFEIVDGQAVARRGPHRASLAANLRSPGAITLFSPSGQRFRSHLLGLAYTDAATGRSVLIASVQDCRGAVLAPNQVVYEGALTGDCEADVRFTYTRRGFEQDVILRQTPPSPAEWGLDPSTTRLEVFTEFTELPAHRRSEIVLRREGDRTRAARMAEPDLIDQQLEFGGLRFGPGLAFSNESMPASGPPVQSVVPTGKSLEKIDGRTFLIEKVDFDAVNQMLSTLPRSTAQVRTRNEKQFTRTATAQALPPPPEGPTVRWADRQFAQALAGRLARPGLVLDYLAFADSLTNWCFRGDTTYLISDLVDLHGVTVLEGTVLKFAPGASLQVWGPLDCQTSTHRPAIFTARDDHSVGQPLTYARGPAGLYAAAALAFKGSARRESVHHVAVRHADVGITVDPQIGIDLRHVQLTRGRVGIAWQAGAEVACRNFLGVDLAVAFHSPAGAGFLRGEHGTLHRIDRLTAGPAAACLLTNCLLVAVTNSAGFGGAQVELLASDAGVFQTFAGGGHYLPATSPYRNSGTRSIDPTLRSNLHELTTEAPLALTRDFTRNTELRARVRRHHGQPDLGYHYPAVDYSWAGRTLAAARLSLTEGVTIGLNPAEAASGLTLGAGSELVAYGHPLRLTRFVTLPAVQENPPNRRNELSPEFVRVQPGPAGDAGLRWRFVESILPGGAGTHLVGGFVAPNAPFELRDCQFAGARLSGGQLGLAFTNCIFDRVHLEVESSQDEPPRQFHHNFFRSGTVQIDLPTSTQVLARNNFFDRTALQVSGTWLHSHNAYMAGFDRLPPHGLTDRIITEDEFLPGPLGPFYYPPRGGSGTLAALLDAGSDTASTLGLAHHTTRTDQAPEDDSRVDIGFHYVALDPQGLPFDRDGDGRPDWLEDANGNGTHEAGESDWRAYDSAQCLPSGLALQVFTPLQ